jgi:hypothetical protein
MDITGQLHAPAALPPMKFVSRYALDMSLGQSKNQSGLCRVSNLDSSVAILQTKYVMCKPSCV